MSKILACTDGSAPYSASVYEHAAWAARRMSADIEVMHVLDLSHKKPEMDDLSGTIGIDARDDLLQHLTELDAVKGKVAQKKGRMILADAQVRLKNLGSNTITLTHRHGALIDTLADIEYSADIVVIGKRGETHDVDGGHLGANLERALRSTKKPMLVAPRAFKDIQHVLIAFDGSHTAKRSVEFAAHHPLLKGLCFDVLNVQPSSKATPEDLTWAVNTLQTSGATAKIVTLHGIPAEAISAHVTKAAINLIVMGAYGHSRIRALMIGSTTTETIRACRVPLLMFR
ncbi:MAG: universal stress protein [Rhodospirillaceae bacterium]|nr:universal stress protein [Rhodospirillaceae bacterium]